MSDPELSIILPCYNEALNIPHLVERFARFREDCDFELILVNNGSTDDTDRVLDEARRRPGNEFLRCVTVSRNIGYGHGIFSGLRTARAEVLAYTHADAQTPPEDVFRALALVRERRIDLARSLVKGRRLERGRTDLFFSRAFTHVIELLWGYRLEDINGQPKLFARTLLDSLVHPPVDFAFDAYLMYAARLQGLTIVDFPVHFGERVYGESKASASPWRKLKTILSYLATIFRIAVLHYHSPGNLLRQIVRFLAAGILTNVTNYIVFIVLLRSLRVYYLIGSAAGFVAGFFVGFFVNRSWTFGAGSGASLSKLAKFFAVNMISLSACLVTVWFFTEPCGVMPEVSQVMGMAVSTVINF